jgi:cation:H+ antiporter
MILDWALAFGGLALLFGGGEALVRGASGIALLARVTPAVVGLTIVAAGTSMPWLRRISRAQGRGSRRQLVETQPSSRLMPTTSW